VRLWCLKGESLHCAGGKQTVFSVVLLEKASVHPCAEGKHTLSCNTKADLNALCVQVLHLLDSATLSPSSLSLQTKQQETLLIKHPPHPSWSQYTLMRQRSRIMMKHCTRSTLTGVFITNSNNSKLWKPIQVISYPLKHSMHQSGLLIVTRTFNRSMKCGPVLCNVHQVWMYFTVTFQISHLT